MTESVFDPFLDIAFKQRTPERTGFTPNLTSVSTASPSWIGTTILVTVELLMYGRLKSGVSVFPSVRLTGRTKGG